MRFVLLLSLLLLLLLLVLFVVGVLFGFNPFSKEVTVQLTLPSRYKKWCQKKWLNPSSNGSPDAGPNGGALFDLATRSGKSVDFGGVIAACGMHETAESGSKIHVTFARGSNAAHTTRRVPMVCMFVSFYLG